MRVDHGTVRSQQVPGARQMDVQPVRAAQRGAQSGHADLDRVLRGPRRVLRPRQVNQPRHVDRPPGFQRENREHQPLLARAERDRPLLVPGAHRAQQSDPDSHQLIVNAGGHGV